MPLSELVPGQKVLVRPKQRSKGFRIKATVVRVNSATVTVAERWVGKKTGKVIEVEKKYRPEFIEPGTW